jgi:hypothetical protein
MPSTINPIRKAKVKAALLQGKSARQSLKEAGYPDASVSHSTGMVVVKCSMNEIKDDILSRVTVENVLKELDDCKKLAQEKGDFSTVARCIELKGKYLAMFRDRTVTEEGTFVDQSAESDTNRVLNLLNNQPN